MRLFSFFRRNRELPPNSGLYFAIVRQARARAFFQSLGVPDTLDGRFDLVVLHAALVFRRLRGLGPQALALADATFDAMTADLDRSVRELGVGDMSVGKRVKAMGQAFYGRAQAYDAALAGTEVLSEVLRRNLYRTTSVDEQVLGRVAEYVRAAAGRLEHQPLADLAAGKLEFPPPA